VFNCKAKNIESRQHFNQFLRRGELNYEILITNDTLNNVVCFETLSPSMVFYPLDNLINPLCQVKCWYPLCNRRLETPLKCSKCKMSQYCDTECQRKDWKECLHKNLCCDKKGLSDLKVKNRSANPGSLNFLMKK